MPAPSSKTKTSDMRLHPDRTWVPIGVAVAGIVSFVVAAFWVGLAYQQILSSQDVQKETLQRLERKIDGVTSEYVTRERFSIFLDALKASNPDLKIPALR